MTDTKTLNSGGGGGGGVKGRDTLAANLQFTVRCASHSPDIVQGYAKIFRRKIVIAVYITNSEGRGLYLDTCSALGQLPVL